MSSQRARGKRALPSVPFNRARSLNAIDVETPKSTKTRPIKPFKGNTAVLSTRADASPTLAGRKNSFPTSQIQTYSPKSTRRTAIIDHCTTPLRNSQKAKQKLFETEEFVLDQDRNVTSVKSSEEELEYSPSNGEKKVARVLPMAPSLHTHGEGINDGVETLEKTDATKTAKDVNTDSNGHAKNSKIYFKNQEITISQTPQKNMRTKSPSAANFTTPAENTDDSCIKVAVRVRPFLQR